MSEYKTGIYVKDGFPARTASSPAEAVAAVFDGFKLSDAAPATEAPVDETPSTDIPDSNALESTEAHEPARPDKPSRFNF